MNEIPADARVGTSDRVATSDNLSTDARARTSSTGANEVRVPADGRFEATAVLVGDRIDLRRVGSERRLANFPLLVACDGAPGVVALFRFGVVVFFGVDKAGQRQFLEGLHLAILQPEPTLETESLWVQVEPGGKERLEDDLLYLSEVDLPRLQLVAIMLGKSVVLNDYERTTAQTFDRLEPLAVDLERGVHRFRPDKALLGFIGATLRDQLEMVGRVEVREKPELLWDQPHLEPLYMRLEEALEIGERHSILERKMELISETARTALDLLQGRRTLRVEWYVVILIVLEILLFCYELFFYHPPGSTG
jgi:uncharacterized Rmd1/YagE family protein